ncbi:PhzF family phenazine biosynthesis protein [Nisaea acidiphila]|uniref:PhzF family phenazine biosynthesis protein n=1 Tax=Nisaea acidiphila TaxID=1862145 RepID=A0A9J7AWL8_9PROT|nr:PhzF family phenazine biosynthesis protein [Nisaea acidiphila]UUX51518.1 PhzF family phenazine biosynthesis protein [Nisaea acidiphila]
MRVPIYQIDAFTDKVFAGNPAAVCPLDTWLNDLTMQSIAAENNLAETAFFVSDETGEADFHLRWFTPTVEVDLCGHATLASSALIFDDLMPERDEVSFRTRSGVLRVRRDGDYCVMNFPSYPPAPRKTPEGLYEALGTTPVSLFDAPQEPERDRLMAVLENEDQVRALRPDFGLLKKLPTVSVMVTAPGWQVDFVSRYFAPNHGIEEDPVTGSNHCLLIPYWAERLGKKELLGRQISARGGELKCSLKGDRVEMAGRAARYLSGHIEI